MPDMFEMRAVNSEGEVVTPDRHCSFCGGQFHDDDTAVRTQNKLLFWRKPTWTHGRCKFLQIITATAKMEIATTIIGGFFFAQTAESLWRGNTNGAMIDFALAIASIIVLFVVSKDFDTIRRNVRDTDEREHEHDDDDIDMIASSPFDDGPNELNALSVKVREGECTSCHAKFTIATGIDVGDPRKPQPGEPALCMECGHVMVFGANLLPREPTDDEIKDMAGDPDLITCQELRGDYVHRRDFTKQAKSYIKERKAFVARTE